MKMKWSKIVLLCGVAATVLVGLLFSEDAAMVTSKVIWIIFDISAAVDAYIQKNKEQLTSDWIPYEKDKLNQCF